MFIIDWERCAALGTTLLSGKSFRTSSGVSMLLPETKCHIIWRESHEWKIWLSYLFEYVSGPSKCAEWEIVICSKHWCPGHVFGPQNAVFMIFTNFLVIWCPYQIEKVMSFEGKCMNGNHCSHISFNKCDQRACRVEGYVNIVAMVKYLVVEMLLYFMFSVLSPWFDAPAGKREKVMPFDEKRTNRNGGMPISFGALHQDACRVGSSGAE